MLFAADQAGGGSSLLTFLPIILLVAAMYFLMIRPQSKRRREAQQMQSGLGPGDEVQTVGGLYATVTAVDNESVTLEAAPGVELRFARGAVARVTNKIHSEAEVDEAEEQDDDSDESDAAKIDKG